nr:aminoacyl-tRNA synthetase, class 1a, anticodon-binding [Tanacetum cinerariifolium]
MRDPTLVRDPTPVREPTPSFVREPTTDSSRPPSPPPRTEESNEAPQTLAATAAGGAEDSAALTALSLKLDRCLHRVTTLENELGITKKVLGGAVLKLVTRVKRLEGLLQQRKRRLVLSDSEGDDATSTEHDIDLASVRMLAHTSLGSGFSDQATGPDAAEVLADTTMPFRSTSTTRRRLRKTFTTSALVHVPENIPAGASVPATATTIPAGSSVAVVVHGAAAPSSSIHTAADKGKAPMVDDSLPADLLTEQECAQAERVASPTEHGLGMSDQRRRELDVAQLIYTKADWLELLAKIATNSALSKQLLGDDVTEENMNERLGMLLLRKRRELAEQSRPTLDAPSAKRANQGAPQVHAPSFPADVSVHAATSSAPVDISVPAVSLAHVAVSSHLDDPLTASEHVSTEPTVVAPTPSSLRKRHKHIAKKRVTLIVDMADAALIKFDSNSGSDDDPLPYAPYASWEMVPSPLGSVHAYHDMAGNTKHFTTLRELLHMKEEPNTFALLLWGDLHVLFQSLDDEDAHDFWHNQDSWRIRSWRLYPRTQVHVLETVDGQ